METGDRKVDGSDTGEGRQRLKNTEVTGDVMKSKKKDVVYLDGPYLRQGDWTDQPYIWVVKRKGYVRRVEEGKTPIVFLSTS